MQRVRVLRSTYLDSVSLMRISKLAGDAPGVTNAVVSMATDTNLILMKNIGFDPAEAGEVSSSDLVVAVEAESRDALEGAFMLVENHIKGGPAAAVGGAAGAGASEGVHPGSLEAAMRQRPEIDLVLVSVPGQYAAYEAHKALLAGKHVMIFSDNVSVEDEKHLKDLGTRDGLLVMGPDCGTSIIGGVALGFANAVPRGQVGVVSASGTGAQEVSSILARMGVGISHIIGTGGRDVVRRIGAATMLTGLKALIDDPATDVIVLISKAPDPDVAERILAAARRSGKPCIICFMGRGPSGKQENLIFAGTLTEAALSVAGELTSSPLSDEKLLAFRATPGEAEIAALRAKLPARGRYLRGLFSGGTLAQEAMFILGPRLGRIHTNMHMEAFPALEDPGVSKGHTVLDLGDDVFTRGRAHPMIDQRYRLDRIGKEAADPETAVILLDVVLGYGCNSDPGGEIAGALARIAPGDARQSMPAAGGPLVVASICGTREDPQGYDGQKRVLQSAGVVVAETNARACEVARGILKGD